MRSTPCGSSAEVTPRLKTATECPRSRRSSTRDRPRLRVPPMIRTRIGRSCDQNELSIKTTIIGPKSRYDFGLVCCIFLCMTARFALLLVLSASLSAQTTVRADNAKPPAPSTNGADSSLSQALASADELLHASKFPEAAAAYKAILEKEPATANAHVGLMRSLVRSQQLSEAEEAGKQAIQAAPLSDLVHATYGDVNFRIGQMGTAEAEYRTALKLDANSARGLCGMGRMYAMVGMNKRAKE